MTKKVIKTFFLDIGGVLLTNGWDHHMRQQAAKKFDFDYEDFNSRHSLCYFVHELGNLSLDQYLTFTLFYKKRNFTIEEFKAFMRAQSKPLPDMIPYLKKIKKQHGIKMVGLSNEGKELTLHRIKTCGIKEILDFFVISCFVGYRKPDPHIFDLALNLSQAEKSEVIYIDDRKTLVDAAKELGIQGIHNSSFENTKKSIEKLFSKK